jgi:hypothetical protein
MYEHKPLVRDGKPLDDADLDDGDEVIFEVATGEVIRIADKDGKVKWQSGKEPGGKAGRMNAVRR